MSKAAVPIGVVAFAILTDCSPVVFVVFAAVSGIVLQVVLKKGGEAA